ncbi:hypothetical protein B0H17DRAFT_1152085 [Mycena rosella]|uniref:Uncharacterized protein n=1 Tax=Mycena rosella TaxID=1033263 RepID=A0AAD7FH53_MYCRO|nr:hypothetical protein B0H17DRAFT_1152085 [Mycena rosella]
MPSLWTLPLLSWLLSLPLAPSLILLCRTFGMFMPLATPQRQSGHVSIASATSSATLPFGMCPLLSPLHLPMASAKRSSPDLSKSEVDSKDPEDSDKQSGGEEDAQAAHAHPRHRRGPHKKCVCKGDAPCVGKAADVGRITCPASANCPNGCFN